MLVVNLVRDARFESIGVRDGFENIWVRDAWFESKARDDLGSGWRYLRSGLNNRVRDARFKTVRVMRC